MNWVTATQLRATCLALLLIMSRASWLSVILALIVPAIAAAASVTVPVRVDQATFPAIPGIAINVGEVFTITASGEACFDTACVTKASPDGSGQGPGSPAARLPGAARHSLVCGIGGQSSSHLFFAGRSTSGVASVSGSFFCGMNEDPGIPSSYADNSGSWTVTISTAVAPPRAGICWRVTETGSLPLLNGGQLCLDERSLLYGDTTAAGVGAFTAFPGSACDGKHPAMFTAVADGSVAVLGVSILMVESLDGRSIFAQCFPTTLEVRVVLSTLSGQGLSWRRGAAFVPGDEFQRVGLVLIAD